MKTVKAFPVLLLTIFSALFLLESCKDAPILGNTPASVLAKSMTLQEKATLLTLGINSKGLPDSTNVLPRFGIPSVGIKADYGLSAQEFKQLSISHNPELAFEYGQNKALLKELGNVNSPTAILLDIDCLMSDSLNHSMADTQYSAEILRAVVSGMADIGGLVAVLHHRPEIKDYPAFLNNKLIKIAVSDSASQIIPSLLNGNDLFACLSANPADVIVKAVKDGILDQSVLDSKVESYLEYLSSCLNFSREPSDLPGFIYTPGLIERECANQSIILLKNDGVLPLAPAKTDKIALYGLVSYDSHFALDRTVSESPFALEPAVRNMYSRLLQLPDSSAQKESSNRKPFQFRADALQADVAVISMKGDCGWSSELIEKVCEAFHFKSRKVVLVLDEEAYDSLCGCVGLADAIVLVMWTGVDTSKAILDVLAGILNPSGRLLDGLNGYDGRYCNGYGLSYSSFVLSKPDVRIDGNVMSASVRVTNVGKVPGMESVSVSVHESGDNGNPQFVGVVKTQTIEPGRSQIVEMPLDIRIAEGMTVHFHFPDNTGEVSTYIPLLQ